MNKRLITGVVVSALAALTLGLAVPASGASSTTTTASDFVPVSPVRILDTRVTNNALEGNGVLKLQVAGTNGVPANATSVTLNVTVADTSDPSYLTVYPDGVARPGTSDVNWPGANSVAFNTVTTKLGSDGAIDIFNHVGHVDVIADLHGYYTDSQVLTTVGPTTATAITTLTTWPESSGWANDTFTRTATVIRHGAVDASLCGSGATQCWFYTGTLSDTGTIVTVPGKPVPNGTAGTIQGSPENGTINGSAKFQFYAASDTPDTSQVPTSVTGTQKGGRITTTNWGELFFPNTVTVNSATLTTYSWLYTAPGTCEHWVDSINPGDDGQSAADGDITGTNACTS